MNDKDKKEEPKVEKICIFTKSYCRYAWKKGNAFDCKAPSDESMPCK